MSTNKTTNYNLHAWEPGDDFLRSEFNENFAAIDGALGALAGDAPIPKKLRIAAGTYMGNGGTLTISLGFRPKVVAAAAKFLFDYPIVALCADGSNNTVISMTDDGFQATGYLNLDYTSTSGLVQGTYANPYSFLAIGWEE